MIYYFCLAFHIKLYRNQIKGGGGVAARLEPQKMRASDSTL